MATDIHIHIDEGFSQDHYECIFGSQSGSIYLRDQYTCPERASNKDYTCRHREQVSNRPHILVDTTPWPMPAQLPASAEQQAAIPDPMGEMEDIFPNLDVLPIAINDDIIAKVNNALKVDQYWLEKYPGFTAHQRRKDIADFLRQHLGKGAYLLFH